MNKQLHAFSYSFSNVNENELNINIDGYIVDSPTQEIYREFWGDETSVSFKSFRDQITQSSARKINISINSGGGHVGDAMAIHDLIEELESKGYDIYTKVIGICASAATYPAMASKNSSITKNSFFMIHTVSGSIWGNVDMIENYARAMRKFNDRIVTFYSQKTGLSEAVINNMMKKETWMDAEEAVAKGFIGSIVNAEAFKNEIKAEHWHFANREVLNIYNQNISKPIKNETMDKKKFGEELINSIRNFFTEKGVKVDDKDPAFTNFQDTITTSLENAFKDVPTQEKIQEMVNTAITEATKNDADNLKNAVNAGLEAKMKNVVTTDNKDYLTKKEVETLITNNLGNPGGEGDGEEKKKNTKSANNRFAGVDWSK